uniref:8.9 kDa family member n=1 Tax=Rhipicephalus zambeziensis TaxID=60191 RepID=A0A224YAD1_9ACAR
MIHSTLSRKQEAIKAHGSETRKICMLIVILAANISANMSVDAKAPIADFSLECGVCTYDFNFMSEGEVANLTEPCAQVTCLASCSSVTVVGCPPPTGAIGGNKEKNEWPYCCSQVQSRVPCNTGGYPEY